MVILPITIPRLKCLGLEVDYLCVSLYRTACAHTHAVTHSDTHTGKKINGTKPLVRESKR